MIPDQGENFPLVIGQRFDQAVKFRPLDEVGRFAVVISGFLSLAFLAASMVLGQVKKLPPNLQRRQLVKVPQRVRRHVGQGTVEPEHGVLQHVIGLLPATDQRVASEHSPGEQPQPLAGMANQFGAGLVVALPHQVQPVLEFRGGLHGSLGGREGVLATLRLLPSPIHATKKPEW